MLLHVPTNTPSSFPPSSPLSAMILPLPVAALLSLLYAEVSDAVTLQLEGRHARGHLSSSSLRRRAVDLQGQFGTTGVGNTGDLLYTSNITIGEKVFLVNIDTGSSDLWVSGAVESSTDSGITASVTYGKGTISGNINLAQVSFAGYTIPNQAYTYATQVVDMPPDQVGLIGLGPFTGSEIRQTAGTSDADPFLDRVFASNKSTPNFLSFTLSRNDDPTQPFASQLTIGEIIDGLENITSQVKNPVPILPKDQLVGQHWNVLVDAIVGPDGQKIDITSNVANQTKPVAVLDSGFSLPPVPRDVSDAFYGRVQGAQFSEDFGTWLIPCEQELNISFVIGGVTYPIHPLDANLKFVNDDGSVTCIGAFQPNPLSFGGGIFDMILGDGFLKNVYTLIDYGDFVSVNVTDTEDPYIQLLSLTDPVQAHQDFVAARLDGVDTTGDSRYALLPASEGQKSPVSGSTSFVSTKEVKDKVKSAAQKTKRIIIIVAIVVGGIILAGILLCCLSCLGLCACLGGRRKAFGFRGVQTKQVYRPLDAPAPISHPQEYGYQGKGAYA